jgi:AraC-like DNA-binding protein
MPDSMVSAVMVPRLIRRMEGVRDGGAAPLVPAAASGEAPVRIAESALRALANRVAERTGDDFLGLRLGAEHQRGQLGVLEMLCRSAPTLRALCERFVRYLPLIHPDIDVSLAVAGDEARFIRRRRRDYPRHEGRHIEEFFLATCLEIGRAVTGGALTPRAVWLGRERPHDAAPLVVFFGTDRLCFGSDTIGFSFDAALLDPATATSDPAMWQVLEQYAAELLERAPRRSRDLLSSTEDAIRGQLTAGDLRIHTVARALGMSARSLQRELSLRHTTFQRLVHGVRCQLAQRYLDVERLPTTQVAALLGYTDARCFVRAYRRWTGRGA